MEYNKYFIIIVIFATIFGIFLAIFTNDLITDNITNNNVKNNTKENKEESENINKDNIKEEEKYENKDSAKEDENENTNEDSAKEEDKINEEPSKSKKTIIAVSYSTDNSYIYPTIVSITSLVINSASNTFYNIYILHPPDFKEKSKICIQINYQLYILIWEINIKA